VARPTKYSTDLAARICVHLRYGAPLEVAAQAECVSPASLQRWQHRYPAFREQLEKARAQCVLDCLKGLNTAAKRGDWRPAAWLLERLEPQAFGPPCLRVQLEAGPSPAQLEALSDEELDALIGERTGARACGCSRPRSPRRGGAARCQPARPTPSRARGAR
jgi:hypothetical protein